MTAQNGPTQFIKNLVAAAKTAQGLPGHFWTTTTDVVAGGTAVAETAVDASYSVPDAARMLLGYRPTDTATNLAMAEAHAAVFAIQGANYKYQPQEVICGNTAEAALLTGGAQQAPSEYYDVFAPVKGGEEWNVTIEPIDAIAGDRDSGVEFTWADVQLGLPVIYSQASREVTVAATGIQAGTAFNINNCHRLIEAGGVLFTGGAKSVDEPNSCTLILKCTAWTPVQEISALMEPIPLASDETVDEACSPAYVTRRSQGVGFTSDRATITADFDLDNAVTNGDGAHYIRWV